MKKNTALIIILLLIGAAGIAYAAQNWKKQETNDPLFAAFKSNCEVDTESPYQDPIYNFRVTFSDDQISCLSRNVIDETHEVYIWQEEAFNSNTLANTVEDSILGKISVNPPTALPNPRVVDQFSTIIDDESVNGDIITSPSCDGVNCPQAKRVLLERFGKTLSIEEYNEEFNLFGRIEFIEE